MFHLKWTPNFSSQRALLVSQTEIPSIQLPESVTACLNTIETFTESQPKTTRTLLNAIFLKTKPLLLQATIDSFFAALFSAVSALVAMRLLKNPDDINYENIKIMVLFVVVFAFSNGLSQFFMMKSTRLRTWSGLGAESFLVGLLSQKLLTLSARAYARQSSGNLKTLVTSDTRNIGRFIEEFVRNFIPALMSMIVVLPLMVYFSGYAGLFGVIVLLLILPIALGLNRFSMVFQDRGQTEQDRLTSRVGEWVKNIRLIRYLGLDEAFVKELNESLRRYLKHVTSEHFMACLIFGISVNWWMVSVTSVVLFAKALKTPLDLSSFFGSLWLLSLLAGYIMFFPNLIRFYGAARISLRRILSFLAEEEQLDFLTNGPDAPEETPVKVIFENVTFKYSSESIPIKNLSLTLTLSKKLAIIGKIGSGKTTFLKLLCGELPPTHGNIFLEFENGERRDLWTKPIHSYWRGKFALVPQEPFVSSDLLKNNISLMNSDEKDEEKILQAAYWAELEADLSLFEKGIQQEIGEAGVNLSGGQKQRLNIARAIYAQRDYLILDDPLSAVDTRTETLLMEKLEKIRSGYVLVTHRTGELMRAEELIVMSEGSVIERGVPSVLAFDPNSETTRVLQAYESETQVPEVSVSRE